jgi:hypothetical protein
MNLQEYIWINMNLQSNMAMWDRFLPAVQHGD